MTEIHDETTIAAISTPTGTGGIGIIRVSGPDAVRIVDQVFGLSAKRKLLSKAQTHTIHYGYIYDRDQTVDQVLVMLMRAPRSYTGEDTVEVQCHGGPYVMQRILEVLFRAGAVPADRGEFSKRAFLHGKMDLTQAEAVMDLITSESRLEHEASMNQLKGYLARRIDDVSSRLLDLTTLIEVNLDYPEYDVEEVTRERLAADTASILSSLQELYRTSDDGIRIKEGVRTVILGRPNVGKSSLMNQMLGVDRAIVTEIPGTTRDVLEEKAECHGVPLRLIDTAGLRETSDPVEQIGVERALSRLQEADLVLWMIDGTDPQYDDLPDIISQKPCLILINKSDQVPEEQHHLSIPGVDPEKILWISAKTGFHLDELGEKIQSMFWSGDFSADDHPMITNLRQKDALRRAIESLKSALIAIQTGYAEDLIMIDYTEAYDALGEISGRTLGSDVIDAIFEQFCLGK